MLKISIISTAWALAKINNLKTMPTHAKVKNIIKNINSVDNKISRLFGVTSNAALNTPEKKITALQKLEDKIKAINKSKESPIDIENRIKKIKDAIAHYQTKAISVKDGSLQKKIPTNFTAYETNSFVARAHEDKFQPKKNISLDSSKEFNPLKNEQLTVKTLAKLDASSMRLFSLSPQPPNISAQSTLLEKYNSVILSNSVAMDNDDVYQGISGNDTYNRFYEIIPDNNNSESKIEKIEDDIYDDNAIYDGDTIYDDIATTATDHIYQSLNELGFIQLYNSSEDKNKDSKA
jgi:hypothetical protein